MLRKPISFLLFICFFFFTGISRAQQGAIESIPDQPCPEAYDLLKDSKGYLWVAHDLGVSRYDGTGFTNLTHPHQNSISMTGLLEDFKGRIWCHNFSGQIFYIQDLQLHLLSEYKYKEEQAFPRMIIYGDELVATSSKGLFVYNLRTSQAKYHSIPKGTNSLAKAGKKVLIFGPSGWHVYETGKAVVKLTPNLKIQKDQTISLQNINYKDTFYLSSNPSGIYYKLTLEKDVIQMHAKVQPASFINTISVNKGKVWINTKDRSYTTDGTEAIEGMNLSDVITDNEGNRWMSSLKKGLCVQYNSQPNTNPDISLFHEDRGIRRMHTEGNTMFWSTATGALYKVDAFSSLHYVFTVPKQAGAIERILPFGDEHLLLAASLATYSYNYKTNALERLPVNITVKDAVLRQGIVYLATTGGIQLLTLKELKKTPPNLIGRVELLNKKNRCRSIAFCGDSLFAAYSDGVFLIHQNTIKPLLYKQNPIYANVIRTVAGKVLIGSFTQGFFILENGTLKNISESEGLASSFVKDIKTIAGTTWLSYADRIQQLDNSLTGVEGYAIPFSKGGIIDFSVLNDRLHISTGDGVFNMQVTKPVADISSATYFDKITANGNYVINSNKLKHYQNYLQFQVSTPFFSPYSKIIYQYRIRNAPNSAWLQGAPGQTTFNVVALEPGEYIFEIVATDESRKVISRPGVYQFSIMPAWYQLWFVRLLAGIILAGLGFYIVRVYYLNRLRNQRIAYEKELAIQAERQRISAEIHDDVGAGLSAIRLLTEITRNGLPESNARQEVGKIHASISELSHKMREVIWSLNTDNDSMENLLHYIRRQALALFENSPIRMKVVFPPQEIPSIVIKGEKRRHIYLSVKEALHNCLKHSGAQNCTLTMRIESGRLYITVADDGKGFVPLQTEYTGNGLPGMKRRMQQVNGVFSVELQEKTKVQFMIPLNEKA